MKPLKSHWRWFAAGVAVALAIGVLAALFLAYQQPALLLDWANVNYCG